jgi:hypothetical protein
MQMQTAQGGQYHPHRLMHQQNYHQYITNIGNVASTAGGVAKIAAERNEKYTELEKSYIFQPISFETLGPINSSGHSFISELGRRISAISGDVRATAFLYQRLSITIQRFNAIAFRGGFITADLDL